MFLTQSLIALPFLIAFVYKCSLFKVDNFVFRLHAITFIFLALFVCSSVSIGGNNEVHCLPFEGIDEKALNNHCSHNPTYILSSALDKKVGTQITYFGIGPEFVKNNEEDKIYQSHYLNIVHCLTLQSFVFFLISYLWKYLEGGLLEKFIRTNTTECCLPKAEKLFNSFLEFFFICYYLNGPFATYGLDYFNHQRDTDNINPMRRLFPLKAKCEYNYFSVDKKIGSLTTLCVLKQNLDNGYFYLFLWYWLVILAVVSTLKLLYTLFIIISPSYRLRAIKRRADLEDLSGAICIDRWFFLNQVSRHIDSSTYRMLTQVFDFECNPEN